MVWDSGCRSDLGRAWGLSRSQELEATHWPPARRELNSRDQCRIATVNLTRPLTRKVLGICPDLIFLKQKLPRPPDKPSPD